MLTYEIKVIDRDSKQTKLKFLLEPDQQHAINFDHYAGHQIIMKVRTGDPIGPNKGAFDNRPSLG